MRIRTLFLSLAFSLVTFAPFSVLAADEAATYNTSQYSGALIATTGEAYDGQLPEANLVLTIGGLINTLIGLLGVIFLILTVYAGILWMTAGGNSDQVKKGKQILINATIGLILTLTSYTISYFVIGLVS